MMQRTSVTSCFLKDSGYEGLKQYLINETGLAFYTDKDEDLASRIRKRLEATKTRDCGAYLDLLRYSDVDQVELDQLIEELTVGETSFFRHHELFEAARSHVLPDLIARNRSCRRLRIWSAGCSIGAEAYSLAMMLSSEFGEELRDWDVSIVGTDINRRCLARARAGVFRSWDLRGLDATQLAVEFTQHGDQWTIDRRHQRWVSFQYHNLVQHTFPSQMHNLGEFDLLLCRNVLIYFEAETTRRIVGQFYDSLVDGGWLLVGHAEPSVSVFRSFRTVNAPGAILYQRLGVQPEGPPDCASIPCVGFTPPLLAKPVCAPSLGLNGASSAKSARAPTTPQKPVPAIPRESCSNVELRPDDLATIQRQADAGDLDTAIRQYEELIEAHPMDPRLHLRVAMLAEQLGHHRRADEALRRAIYLNPESALAHYFAGLLEQKRGRHGAALNAYEHVLQLLSSQSDGATVSDADGMVVGELRQLIRMQQEVLRNP